MFLEFLNFRLLWLDLVVVLVEVMNFEVIVFFTLTYSWISETLSLSGGVKFN